MFPATLGLIQWSQGSHARADVGHAIVFVFVLGDVQRVRENTRHLQESIQNKWVSNAVIRRLSHYIQIIRRNYDFVCTLRAHTNNVR